MNTDDKFGIAAGLMALGLAAGVILLGQLTYDKKYEELSKAALAAADSKDAAGKDAPKDLPAAKDAPAPPKPRFFYSLIPHRELVKPEAIFDGIVCLLALPGGIVLFVLGMFDSTSEVASGGEVATDKPAPA